MVTLLGYTDSLRRKSQRSSLRFSISMAFDTLRPRKGSYDQPYLDTPPHDSPVHARDIEILAREAHVPLDDVAQLYARELAALTAGARITSVLPYLHDPEGPPILLSTLSSESRSSDSRGPCACPDHSHADSAPLLKRV